MQLGPHVLCRLWNPGPQTRSRKRGVDRGGCRGEARSALPLVPIPSQDSSRGAAGTGSNQPSYREVTQLFRVDLQKNSLNLVTEASWPIRLEAYMPSSSQQSASQHSCRPCCFPVSLTQYVMPRSSLHVLLFPPESVVYLSAPPIGQRLSEGRNGVPSASRSPGPATVPLQTTAAPSVLAE